jgi:Ala-tRNA(Pro) deacylase
VCLADEQFVLAVVPAHRRVDVEALRLLAGALNVRVARESEFSPCYPDCELGAMPPFGALYHQRVFVDQSLVGEAEMCFDAGTHTDAIRMHYGDFAELARPTVGAFACPPRPGSVIDSKATV